jgi:predicted metalloprotease
MSYQRPEDRVVEDRDRVVVSQSGGNTGMAVLAGVLIVLAIVFLVWLLGSNDGTTTTTTGSSVETTAPVETTLPAETTLTTAAP